MLQRIKVTKIELFCLVSTAALVILLLAVFFAAQSRDYLTVTAWRDGEVALPEKVDINRADSEALQRLPGIGPVLAGRIVDYRAAHGDFRTVEELLAVEGIGPATLEGLVDLIEIGGTP